MRNPPRCHCCDEKQDLKVATLGLHTKALNALLNANIYFLHQLQALSEAELRRTKNLGPKGVAEIKAALEALGFKLKERGSYSPGIGYTHK